MKNAYNWFTFISSQELTEEQMEWLALDLGNKLKDCFEVTTNGTKRNKFLYTVNGDLGGPKLNNLQINEAIENIDYIYDFEFDYSGTKEI